MFELGENRFQKSFSVKPTCLAVTENDIFRKMTSGWPIFSALTRKWFSPLLCPIPFLLCSFAAPSSLFNSVFRRYALIFPWNFLLMLFFFDFSKIRKAGCLFSLFFSLNFLGFFFHPYWKVDGFIVFVFSPRFFFFFFPILSQPEIVLFGGCTIVELYCVLV